MITKIFTFYDSKVEAYSPPAFMVHRGAAIRSFIELANDGASSVSKYPADFTLFEIGEFDDSTGVITAYEAKVSLGNGLDFRQKDEKLAHDVVGNALTA
jgi:hypothetical protein